MADLKITGLPALVEAGIQSTDVLALADLSATETKKVTVKDLVSAGLTSLSDGDIPASKVGTLGTNQVATGAIQDGAVTNVKLAYSSISLGGVSISLGATDATPAFVLTDATGYLTSNLSGTITNAQLAGSIAGTKLSDTTITYAKLNLSDGDIPGAKIATGGITATQLATDSVTASELADDAVDTAAIADGAVVAASIATDTITSNQIAVNAITASELADNAVDAGAIAANAVTTEKILNANVTAAKLAANLPGTILASGAIGSTQLAADSVSATELADNAVVSDAIAASAVTDAKISAVSGTKITDGTITASKLATANIDRSLNVASGSLGINNTVTAATRSGITYNAQGLITGTVALAASDLPLATTSAVGAVSVGTGLAVTGAGALSLSNSVTAATISGITYNAQGQITATTALVAGDLPAATTSAKGAVLITSGGGISVDGSGAISTSTSGITAGTYTKVTINSKGVATAGTSLVAGDIPSLAATKITSGTFDVGRFGTNTIPGSKFADSSVCQFTGAQSTSGVVTFPTAEFKGQFFYDLTNDDLYVYDGSAFQPVTITSGEIIYAGNYRADTNKITSLTAAGTAQGFTVNAALQAASAANNRYYFVCDKSGTGTSPAPTVTINPPDMILSNGASWEKLDISNFIAGQVASNIGVTATGGIQNTNVQSVLEELDTEKLNLTGGTLTGNLNLNQSSSIIFEGSTPDDFETTLTVIDPTADHTVRLPNITGTLVSSGDTGTVTSTMIEDGTILNVDINASAGIALSKLEAVTSAYVIVGNESNIPAAVAVSGDISISNAGVVAIAAGAIVDADIKSDAAISGSKIVAGTTSVVGVVQLVDSTSSTSTTLAATGASVKGAKDAADTAQSTADAALPKTGGSLTGNLIVGNAKQIRFSELTANGANYVSLQAPDTLAADVSYTLPSAAPTANGQVLAGTTAGVLSWTDDPTGQWVTNGTNVYYDGGNVGIGTGPSPGNLLHIKGGSNTKLLIETTGTGHATGIQIKHASGNAAEQTWQIQTDGTADGDLKLRNATAGTDAIVVNPSNKVGVGTASPDALIHISSADIGAPQNANSGLMIEGNSADLQFMSANTSYNHIFFGDADDPNIGVIAYHHASNSNSMVFTTNTATALTLDSSQNAIFAGSVTATTADFNVGTGEFDIYSTGSGENASLRLLNSNATADNTVAIQLGPCNNVVGAQIRARATDDFTTTAKRDCGLELLTRLNGGFVEALDFTPEGKATFVGSAEFSSNIGVGISPSHALDVHKSNSSGVIGLHIRNANNTAGNNTEIRFQGTNSSNAAFTTGRIVAEMTDNYNQYSDLHFYVHALGATNKKLTLKGSNGGLGIGTDAPDQLLHVEGSSTAIIRLTDTDTAAADNSIIGGIEFETKDSQGPGINASMGAYIKDTTNGDAYLAFKVGTAASTYAEALRIDSGGLKTANGIGIGMDRSGATLAVNGSLYLGAGGNTSWQKVSLGGSGNTTGDDLSINNWGDAEGDYWHIGVNSTLNASGNTAKTNEAKRSAAITLDGRMGRMFLETSQTSTASRNTTHTWDRGGDYTLTGMLRVAAGNGLHFGANDDTGRTVTSNVLDEYEEGSFDVNYKTGAAGSNTLSAASYTTTGGFYTRVGRIVHIQVRLKCTSATTVGGQIVIEGLPFSGHSSNVSGGVYITASEMLGSSNDARIIVDGTQLEFLTHAGSALASGAGGLSFTGEFMCAGTYIAAY